MRGSLCQNAGLSEILRQEDLAAGHVVCGVDEALQRGERAGELGAGARVGIPAAHVGGYGVGQGAHGCSRYGGGGALCRGAYELSRAQGVVKGGVALVVCLLAAIVQNGGGNGKGVGGVLRLDALHGQQVDGEVYHGLGVADEATHSQGVCGVVLARGAGGHGPETGGGGIQHVSGEGAQVGIVNQGYLCIELCFHGVFSLIW